MSSDYKTEKERGKESQKYDCRECWLPLYEAVFKKIG
jgi:hypothetical protein